MKMLSCLLLLVWPLMLTAQTREVFPGELMLWAEVEDTGHTPLAREMVLITLKGIYRRHITREQLVQPDLEGFSWTQLGNDTWREERLNGEKVKTFTRPMAIYPDRAGTLTIGSFTHVLTLTDEEDNWFEHKVVSPSLTIEVAPAPAGHDWWFPAKNLKVSDQWSNAPDQLTPGEGVLRVIRVEALGVMPEMIPPMPELTSPSAMIFAHPDKRFVELSPEGPQSYAFWRWTIRPSNDTSTIVEPLSFDYFDTVGRTEQTVTISAQRVAYGSVVPEAIVVQPQPALTQLPGWPLALLAVLVGTVGVLGTVWGRHMQGVTALQRFALFDPLARQMRRAARHQHTDGVRRAATAMLLRDGPSDRRRQLLHQLDQSIFAPQSAAPKLMTFVRAYLRGA